MSDDSYVPEKEEAESSSDHLFYADNSPVENTESRLSPMTTFQPTLPIPQMKGARRQKSLQFVATETLFLIMKEKNRGINEINPSEIASDLRITRRRIYDIIHVFTCLKLLRRISSRLYEYDGLIAMQQFLTTLYTIPFDVFEEYCFKENALKDIEKEDTTTRHITILCLKYLFLYIKSGKKAFNNKHLASFIIKDLHTTSHTAHISPTRLKSIERRLYDIISVFCGLGLLKRRIDALQWNLSSSEYKETMTEAKYYKGLNMMSTIDYFFLSSENETAVIPPEVFDLIWKQLYQLYCDIHLIIAVDMEYLSLRYTTLSGPNVDIPMIPEVLGVPPFPEDKVELNDLSFQEFPPKKRGITHPVVTIQTKQYQTEATKESDVSANPMNSNNENRETPNEEIQTEIESLIDDLYLSTPTHRQLSPLPLSPFINSPFRIFSPPRYNDIAIPDYHFSSSPLRSSNQSNFITPLPCLHAVSENTIQSFIPSLDIQNIVKKEEVNEQRS